MKIWSCKYEIIENGVSKSDVKYFDDSNIMLDCVCDTSFEMFNYMLNVCLSFCNNNKYTFIGFEIIAD